MARLDINLVSSFVGKGLEREALLLKALLEQNACYVNTVHYTSLNAPLIRADISIFLEVVMPIALNLSRENWLCPNSEWWYSINDQHLSRFSKILCKTHDCYDIWSQKVGAEKCVYTGFESRDIFRPEIAKETAFLHLAGESEFKNTEAVIRAWRTTEARDFPTLTVVTRHEKFWKLCEEPPWKNIVCIRERLSDDAIIDLMNRNLFHLMPSMYEGFGHAIHEALGCEGLVITTNAPPMNSYRGILEECMVAVTKKTPRSLAVLNEVAPIAVVQAIQRALHIKAMDREWDSFGHRLPDEKRFGVRGKTARQRFLEDREEFRKTVVHLIDEFQLHRGATRA